MVQQTMADLIAAYELSVVEVSESEVLLKSQNYFIDIFAGKEGVGVVYFDKMSRPVKGYNLFLYLVNRRRGLLVFSESQAQAARGGRALDQPHQRPRLRDTRHSVAA